MSYYVSASLCDLITSLCVSVSRSLYIAANDIILFFLMAE